MDALTDKELIKELQEKLFKQNQIQVNEQLLMKQLELVNEKLKRSETLKGDFISNIRNELNNPMAALLGLSKSMKQPSLLKDQLMAIGDSIYQEICVLDFQLRNIFAAAEIEAGEYSLEVMPADIHSLIRSTMNLCGARISEKKIEVNLPVTSVVDDKQYFTTDPGKLQLILLNLFANAIEFSKLCGEIKIRFHIAGGLLNVSVQDAGIGIQSSDLEIIFDRFKQLNTGLSKSYRGHGLGLAVVKAYLDVLKGSIEIKSKVDAGCLVTLQIPELDTGMLTDGFASDGNEFFFSNEEKF